jgi:structural maintenance of chromosome 2
MAFSLMTKKGNNQQITSSSIVTCECDVYNSFGTLSSGSASNYSIVRMTFQILNALNKELATEEAAPKVLQIRMTKEKKKLNFARKTEQELDPEMHEIKLTEEHMGGNSSFYIIRAAEEMTANSTQLKNDNEEEKARQANETKDIKRIETSIKDFGNSRDNKFAALKSSVDNITKSLSKSSVTTSYPEPMNDIELLYQRKGIG